MSKRSTIDTTREKRLFRKPNAVEIQYLYPIIRQGKCCSS